MDDNVEDKNILEATVAIKTTIYSFVTVKGKDANSIIQKALDTCPIHNSDQHDFIDTISEALGLYLSNKCSIKIDDGNDHFTDEDTMRDVVEELCFDGRIF